jgi:hypothetical protein
MNNAGLTNSNLLDVLTRGGLITVLFHKRKPMV